MASRSRATELTADGPYGTCFRRRERPGPMVLIGGGSGMSPLWSILNDHVESGEQRPVRLLLRRPHPAATCSISTNSPSSPRGIPEFSFIPVLSHAEAGDAAWDGETRLRPPSVVRAKLKQLALDRARSTSMPAARRR